MKQARLTPDLEREICSQIILLAARSKNGKVTWAQLADVTGFSRQALSANSAISSQYREVNGIQKTAISSERRIQELEDKLAKSQAECKRLKKTLEEYDKKYVRWLYNATNANLTTEQLNTPVPESLKTSGRKKDQK